MSDVVLVDNGGANVASLVYAFERLGAEAVVSRDPAVIRAARRVVLPGVGAAGNAMRMLGERELEPVLRALTQPVLGICLGMQLLCEHSEEDDTTCLGLIPARLVRLVGTPECPSPHMGWNSLQVRRPDPLLEGLDARAYVYFVHGFAAHPTDATLATSDHGTTFTAVLRARNFWGTQFHPERSSAAGARLLANFLTLDASCS